MMSLDDRLRELGGALEVDEATLTEAVLARLDEMPGGDARRRPWRRGGRAAVWVLVVVVGAAFAVPSSRRTLADWFGLDGVEIERRPDLTVPDTVPAIDASVPLAGPGENEFVTADGRSVLLSVVDGTLDDGVITKSIGTGTDVVEVVVDGRPGVWIDGRPHELAVMRDGEVVFERFAGNTLLWQDGAVIRRLEGAESLDQALTVASTLGPSSNP